MNVAPKVWFQFLISQPSSTQGEHVRPSVCAFSFRSVSRITQKVALEESLKHFEG